MIEAELRLPRDKQVFVVDEKLHAELTIVNTGDELVLIERVDDIVPMGFVPLKIVPANVVGRNAIINRTIEPKARLCLELSLEAREEGVYLWRPTVVYCEGGERVRFPVATVRLHVTDKFERLRTSVITPFDISMKASPAQETELPRPIIIEDKFEWSPPPVITLRWRKLSPARGNELPKIPQPYRERALREEAPNKPGLERSALRSLELLLEALLRAMEVNFSRADVEILRNLVEDLIKAHEG